jgi:hypothetical protein
MFPVALCNDHMRRTFSGPLTKTQLDRARNERIDNGQFGITTVGVAAEIAARLQTYMLVRCAMSVLTGLGFWVFTAVAGLELTR